MSKDVIIEALKKHLDEAYDEIKVLRARLKNLEAKQGSDKYEVVGTTTLKVKKGAEVVACNDIGDEK